MGRNSAPTVPTEAAIAPLSSDQITQQLQAKQAQLQSVRKDREQLIGAAYAGDDGARSKLNNLTESAARIQMEIEDLHTLRGHAQQRELAEREKADAQRKVERAAARQLATLELVKLAADADAKIGELKAAFEALEQCGARICREFPEHTAQNAVLLRLSAGRAELGGQAASGNRAATAACRVAGLQRFVSCPYSTPLEMRSLEQTFTEFTKEFIQQA